MNSVQIYGIYENDNIEQCVFVGTAEECSKFLNTTVNSMRSMISHRILYRGNLKDGLRYKIISLYREKRDE